MASLLVNFLLCFELWIESCYMMRGVKIVSESTFYGLTSLLSEREEF